MTCSYYALSFTRTSSCVTNPLFVPSTSGPPFYVWDHMLNMWSRATKQEIKEEPERWILHQIEAEEEEEAETHDNEDVESHWEDEEDDKLYDNMPRVSPPPSPTPTPPCYEDEWVNEWIDEERDIINAFPRPPPFPLPLNANPHPLQPTATAGRSPSPQIYSHFGTPMTDEEVDAEIRDDPFWHNMIKAEQNARWMIENMRRRAVAAGFRPAASIRSEEEAAQGQDSIATPEQRTMLMGDDNGAQARPATLTRVYTSIATGDNNEDNGDEEEVNISWQRGTRLEQGDNNEDYLMTCAHRYKRLM
jgi:hypothetical protein